RFLRGFRRRSCSGLRTNRAQTHVVGHGPDGANLIEAFAPPHPSHGPSSRTQECADCINLTAIHCLSSRVKQQAADVWVLLNNKPAGVSRPDLDSLEFCERLAVVI